MATFFDIIAVNNASGKIGIAVTANQEKHNRFRNEGKVPLALSTVHHVFFNKSVKDFEAARRAIIEVAGGWFVPTVPEEVTVVSVVEGGNALSNEQDEAIRNGWGKKVVFYTTYIAYKEVDDKVVAQRRTNVSLGTELRTTGDRTVIELVAPGNLKQFSLGSPLAQAPCTVYADPEAPVVDILQELTYLVSSPTVLEVDATATLPALGNVAFKVIRDTETGLYSQA